MTDSLNIAVLGAGSWGTALAALMAMTPVTGEVDARAGRWSFDAPSRDAGTPNLFGGQLLGQTLMWPFRFIGRLLRGQ